MACEQTPQNKIESGSSNCYVEESDNQGPLQIDGSPIESLSGMFNMWRMNLLTDDDFKEETLGSIEVDNDVLKDLCVTRVSHKMRRLLRHFGNTAAAEEIIFLANEKCRENPCVKVATIPPVPQSLPAVARKGLFATRDIKEGEFVLVPLPVLLTSPEECGRDRMGVSLPNIILYNGLHNDFAHYEVIDSSKSRKRKRETDSYHIRRKKRAIEENNNIYSRSTKYPSDDEDYKNETAYDKYDICIDVSSSDEMKAMRRNCVPNCAIRYVILHQRMEVFITAQTDIRKGEELTIMHDYDSNMSNKIIQCAHTYDSHNVCIYEKERQETIRKFVSVVSEEDKQVGKST